MAEQPKETWEQNADLLLRINQNLGSLNSLPDDKTNKQLLQSVILLAQIVGTLNQKLKLP